MIIIAWAALFSWPIVSYVFYRKLSLPMALCATIIGGYLLLPSGGKMWVDLPILPPLSKSSIPSLSALFLTFLVLRDRQTQHNVLPGWLPRDRVALGLIAMVTVGVFGAVFTNGDRLVYGTRILPGLSLYDGFSILLDLCVMFIPIILARKVLGTVEGQRTLLLVLVGSALVYSVLALYEVRFSPQLNIKLYGYFPHSFAQHVRGGGFRPIVFLKHGLALGIFMTFAVIAAAAIYRHTKGPDRGRWGLATAWLFGTLVLAKSLGALLIALVLLPITLFLKLRTQLLLAACIAGTILVYPALRSADLVPVEKLLSYAERISPERAGSLGVRFNNEEILLEKARDRPIFGWGGWGRHRVFDETGSDLSITDGSWVVELGLGGWFRYIPLFGLLAWPVIGLWWKQRDRVDPICVALALLVCAKLVDLVPNSGFPAYTWLMAGALWGRLELNAAELENVPTPVKSKTATKGTVYARDFGETAKATSRAEPRYSRTFDKPVKPSRAKPSRDEPAPYRRSHLRPGDSK